MGAEGGVLEVLAHAVKTLSDRSNAFVSQVEQLLTEIVAASAGGRSAREDIGVHGPCISTTPAGVEKIDIMKMYETMNRMSTDVTNRSEGLARAISVTRERVMFLSELKQRLNRRLLELECFRDETKPSDRMPGRETAGHTDHLKIRYTMERERLVHENRMKDGAGIPEFVPDEPDPGTEKEGALFSLPVPPAALPSGAEKNSHELGDNVELF
jgi:hypothetical protein